MYALTSLTRELTFSECILDTRSCRSHSTAASFPRSRSEGHYRGRNPIPDCQCIWASRLEKKMKMSGHSHHRTHRIKRVPHRVQIRLGDTPVCSCEPERRASRPSLCSCGSSDSCARTLPFSRGFVCPWGVAIQKSAVFVSNEHAFHSSDRSSGNALRPIHQGEHL